MEEKTNSAQEPHDPQVGDYLGHYQLVQLLGAGGMGVVFKAYEKALNRHVAIKVLARRLSNDRDFTHRFLNEAQAVASLNHTNIANIYYIAQQDQVLFFAMELVDGIELETLLQRKKQLGLRETLNYIRQAALGLNHAWKHSVIHRDIKPANLMVTRDGIVKVCDFGLAKEVKADHAVTTTQMVMGTPYYMSPEQTRGEHVDFRSDIYSLGVTLYHLLAGRPPFVAENAMGIMIAHIQNPIPPIQQFNPQIPLTVNRVIHRAMAKNREDRYQTYLDFIKDLEKLVDNPLPALTPDSTPAIPVKSSHSLPFTLGLIIIALTLGIFLTVNLKTSTPTRPLINPVHTSQNTSPPSSLIQPHPAPIIPQPPDPNELEEAAKRLFLSQQSKAEPLLVEKKYGAALSQWNPWQKDFENTNSWKKRQQALRHIDEMARTEWVRIQTVASLSRSHDQYDQALEIYDDFLLRIEGLSILTPEVTAERTAVAKQKVDFNARLELARLNSEQIRHQKLEKAMSPLSQLVAKYQFEDAAKMAAANAQANTLPDLQATLDSIVRDTEKMAALQKNFLTRMQDQPPKGIITLATRTNNESGELIHFDHNNLVLSQSLADGGAVEVTLPWTRLATPEYLRLLYTYLDKQRADEIFSYALVLYFLGLPDDAKSNFQLSANMDTKYSGAITFYLDRIDTMQRAQLESGAQRIWDRITSNRILQKNESVKRDLELLTVQFSESDCVKKNHREEIHQIELSLLEDEAMEIQRNQLIKRAMTWGRGKVLHVGSAPGQQATFEAALKGASEVKDPILILVHEGQYDENIAISGETKNVEIAGIPGDMILVKSLSIASANTVGTISGLVFAGHLPRNNQPTNLPIPITVQIGNFNPSGASKGEVRFTDCAFLSDGLAVFRTGNLTIENCFFSTRYFDLGLINKNISSIRLNHNTYINSFKGRDFGRLTDVASVVAWHNRNSPLSDAPTAYEITNNIFARPELVYRFSPQQSPQINPNKFSSNHNFFLPPRGFDLVIFNDFTPFGASAPSQTFPSLDSWKTTGADTHSISAENPGFQSPAQDNYRLKTDSLCLGKASDNKNLGVVWDEFQWKAFDRSYHLLKTNPPKWTIPESMPNERR